MLHASPSPTSDLSAVALAGGSANSTTVVQLLLDAQQAIGADVDAALRCIRQAASLLETPAEPAAPSRGGLAHWQISRVKRHIDDNLDYPIQVADLASIARLSAGYFSNAFKTSLGASPHAYVVSRRLARAMDLMQSTGKPLCEIAMDCGFSDQAHLCRQFRRAMDMSPNAWRRSQIGEQSTARRQ
jgi:AraC family transcriptional regulator